MNLIEKLHALLVTDDLNIWHYPCRKEGPRFFYWLMSEPDNQEGHGFDTLEEMIESAYGHIDPLKKPLPDRVTRPEFAGGDEG